MAATSSPVISPRISFSHDLKENKFVPGDTNQARSDAFLLNSTIDFVFSIDDKTFSQQRLSSADEIFANGKILPVGIKKIRESQPTLEHPDRPRKTEENTKNVKRLIEFLSTSSDDDHKEEKPMPKPFWQFRRSSSLNCENGRFLQFLTRSNSTGSASNQNSNPLAKQHSLKGESALKKDSVVQSFDAYNNYLKKSNSRSYGNALRFTPVLNIPPAYISAKGTASLFRIGSFFCNKKSKKNNKKR